MNGFFGVVVIKGLTFKGAQVRDFDRKVFMKPSRVGDFGAKI
jgi:hypothetical protein